MAGRRRSSAAASRSRRSKSRPTARSGCSCGWSRREYRQGRLPLHASRRKAGNSDEKLPITLTIGEELPAKLKLTTNFPALRGTATTSFKYRVTRHQRQRPRRDGQFQRRRAEEFPGQLYRGLWQPADHQHPDRGRQVEGCRGLADDPARDPGRRLQAGAACQDRGGQRRSPGQPDDRRPAAPRALGRRRPAVSGEAYAGQSSQLTVVLRNDGSEAARDIELSATDPGGLEIRASTRSSCRSSPAGATQNVKVTLTPSPARDRRRLPDDNPRQRRRRAVRIRQFPHHRADLDAVGRGRHRDHRDRAAGRRLRRRPLRPPLRESAGIAHGGRRWCIRAEGLTKRYGAPCRGRPYRSRSRAPARSSAFSGRTARARRRRS